MEDKSVQTDESFLRNINKEDKGTEIEEEYFENQNNSNTNTNTNSNTNTNLTENPVKNKKRKRDKTSCSGCHPVFMLNQLAHMDYGGCMYDGEIFE